MKEGIKDDWFVLGKQSTQEEQLTVERNWLYGINTKKYALVLQFFVRNQLPSLTITPGVTIYAELVFFPSALPLRALIKQQFSSKDIDTIEGYKNWNEVALEETKLSQSNPFINNYPFIIENVKPVQFNNQWWLQDNEKNIMKLSDSFANIWKLLSISGGRELSVSLTGKENNYTPVGAWLNNNYKLL